MKTTSLETQRLSALDLANQVRSREAEIRRKIKSGELDPVDVLEGTDLAMPVGRFLRSVPRVHNVKASRMAHNAGVTMHHRLNQRSHQRLGVTPEQRAALADELRGRGFGGAR